MKKTTVHIIVWNVFGHTGGSRYLFEVCKRLVRYYNVRLYVENFTPNWKRDFSSVGVPLILLSQPSLSHYIRTFPFYMTKNLFLLRKYIGKKDIVLAVSFPYTTMATLLSKKVIHLCFEPPPHLYDDEYVKAEFLPAAQRAFKRFGALFRFIDFYGVKSAKKLIAFNPSVGVAITRVYGRIPDAYTSLGVDTNHFSPSKPALFTRKRGEFIISHSTDYTITKGTNFLLRALPLVLKKRQKVRLYISDSVKNNESRKRLLEFVTTHHLKDRVRFVGTVPYAQLPSFYRSSDVFCFTGSPLCIGSTQASLSVLEAQACGTPVIRSIGNSDEVIYGQTGYLINPLDTKSLVKTILKIASLTAEERKLMGERARSHVKENYKWDDVARCIHQVIDQLDL